jgi:Co/Zn/Cd efflux system component
VNTIVSYSLANRCCRLVEGKPSHVAWILGSDVPKVSKCERVILDESVFGPSFLNSMDKKPKHRDPAYKTAPIVCATLNLVMLFLEGSAGLWIGSAALLADAGDFLEDATVLGLAFVAMGWSERARAAAGLFQGLATAGVGIGAIAQIVHRVLEGGAPSSALMGRVAVLALSVNGYCAYRLIRFRGGDAAMRGIWLSTRNDATLNVLTVVAAVFIALTESGWPDIIAGAIIATVNLAGSIEVISVATGEMRKRDSN